MSGEFDLDAALDELDSLDVDGILNQPEKPKRITSTDRLETAFIEIVEFYREHGRKPSSDTLEISERKLGARLDGFLIDDVRAEAVRHLDEFGLLQSADVAASLEEFLESGDLDFLDDSEASAIYDLSGLPVLEKSRESFETKRRTKARDFQNFEHIFAHMYQQIHAGDYTLEPFAGAPTIKKGEFFVLNGIMLFVAEVGERKVVGAASPRPKERLRLIFENGTESEMYLRSLASALGEDKSSKHLVPKHIDLSSLSSLERLSGHIYVLKSLSTAPEVSTIPNLYKIGYCSTDVSKRIANAHREPTYFMAPVQIVRDYRVYDMNIAVLEHLIHKVFANARLDITQINEAGNQVNVTEWFTVPLEAIDDAISLIETGEIVNYRYSNQAQTLIKISE